MIKVGNDNLEISKSVFVDLSKLKVGMVVKNYSQMCKLLNENELAGNSKKYQDKRWKLNFLYERQGHKYIIREIYDMPLPFDIDSNKKYIDMICGSLLIVLCAFNDDKVVLSKNALMKDIGIVNKFYGERDINNLLRIAPALKSNDESEDVIQYFVSEFYRIISARSGTYLQRALNKLVDMHLIKYSNTYLLIYDKGDISLRGSGIVDYTSKRIEVSKEDDRNTIEAIYNDVLVEFGYDGESSLSYRDLADRKLFYDEVGRRIKREFGCVSHIKSLEIDIFDRGNLKRYLDLKINKLGVNAKFVEISKKAFQTRFANNQAKIYEAMGSELGDEVLLCANTYVEKEHILVDALVKFEEGGGNNN